MDCSLPGSSIHGIFQAKVLEWVPLPSPETWLDSIISSRLILIFVCLQIDWIRFSFLRIRLKGKSKHIPRFTPTNTDWILLIQTTVVGCYQGGINLFPTLGKKRKTWKHIPGKSLAISKVSKCPTNKTALQGQWCYIKENKINFSMYQAVWFQIEKWVHHGCILSPCLFNLYAEHIMQNARLEEAQAGIKISGRNINNLKYADTLPLWQKVKN